jgi:hypothetical protein
MWYLATGPWFAAWLLAVWVAVFDDSKDAWLDGAAGAANYVAGVCPTHYARRWQLGWANCQKTVLM